MGNSKAIIPRVIARVIARLIARVIARLIARVIARANRNRKGNIARLIAMEIARLVARVIARLIARVIARLIAIRVANKESVPGTPGVMRGRRARFHLFLSLLDCRQDVLFIANDWQTGLLPVYHLYKYRRNNTYRNSRCMFVIHNIGYQARSSICTTD